MKKIIAILFLALSSTLLTRRCSAQFNTYHPFPDSNAYWNETVTDGSCGTGVDLRRYVFDISGDTITNGYTYHKVYRTWGYWSNSCSTPYQLWLYYRAFYAGYRTDTMKRVYACCVYNGSPHDSLLYDFNLKVGDTLTQYTSRPQGGLWPCTVHSIDSVFIGSNYRKRFNIAIAGDTNPMHVPSVVEGVGSTQGLFEYMEVPFESGTSLDCFTQNTITWKPPYGNPYGNCGLYYAGVSAVVALKEGISVYPNPSTGKFTLQAKSEKLRAKSVVVYNVLGLRVLTEILRSTQDDKVMDLSNQPNGVYLYRLIDDNGNAIGEGKIIVQR